MPEMLWIGGLVILAVGLVPLWIAWMRVGRRKRYFYGGAADPLTRTRPAPGDSEGRPRTVVEVDDFDPVTPVAPEELPRDPQTPDTGPAREGSPGWTDVTDAPPTAEDRAGDPAPPHPEPTDPRRPGPGRREP